MNWLIVRRLERESGIPRTGTINIKRREVSPISFISTSRSSRNRYCKSHASFSSSQCSLQWPITFFFGRKTKFLDIDVISRSRSEHVFFCQLPDATKEIQYLCEELKKKRKNHHWPWKLRKKYSYQSIESMLDHNSHRHNSKRYFTDRWPHFPRTWRDDNYKW